MDDAPMLRTSTGKPDTTARHILWALAEHAHEDGTNAFPSVLRIQYRTGFDRRTVQRALRRLEDAGLIVPDGTVRGCTRWRLAMELRRPPSDWEELEAEEEAGRASAAERQRRSRAKRVTHSDDVTVTHSGDVTVTDADDVTDPCHALQVRTSRTLSAHVTHSTPPEPPMNHQEPKASRPQPPPSRPDAAPQPPAADTPATAQTLVAEWLDRTTKRPPSTVIGQVAKHTRALLAEGIDPDDVRRGLARWMTKGLHPTTLPAVVNEVMNATPARPRTAYVPEIF